MTGFFFAAGPMSVSIPNAFLPGRCVGDYVMSYDVRAGEVTELNRLADALPVAIERANQVLRESFDESAAYVAAGKEISQILARINHLISRLK
jgi:hypothetical protein